MAYTGPFPHNNAGSVSAIIVSATSFTGNVGNTGTIGPGDASGTGILVTDGSTINGAISNNGAIDVVGNGILVTGNGGNSYVIKGIANGPLGNITAGSNAITVESTARFAGGIRNAGMVSAGTIGVDVVNVATFAGGIDNGGAIDAGIGIAALSISDFSGGITNTGTIDAEADGIVLGLENTFSGNVINRGAITATTGNGVFVTGVDLTGAGTFSGTVSNSGLIIADDDGLDIQEVGLSHFSGTIGNSGRITATVDNGILIAKLATDGNFIGNIINSGPVTSVSSQGIVITNVATIGTATFSGAISNAGAISAKQTGFKIDTVGSTRFSGTISNSGEVTSTSGQGVLITKVASAGAGTFASTINNAGTILAKETGLKVQSVGGTRFAGTISNNGAVTSKSGVGVHIDDIADAGSFTGTIANKGAISANSGEGIVITNVASAGTATFSGTINNAGTILAKETGFRIVTVGSTRFSGTISNSGAITSNSGDGILIDALNVGGKFAGAITNSGAISALRVGLDIQVAGGSGFFGNIINSGAIKSKSVTAAGIEIQGIATAGSFTGTIANEGAISAVADLSLLNIGESGFSGGISNSGALAAADDDGFDIQFVAQFGTFVGNIANSGMIFAGTVPNAADLRINTVGAAGFFGNIANSGKILSPHTGISVVHVATNGRFKGSIINTGSIAAQENGIGTSFVGRTWSGGITNSGSISAQDGIGVDVNLDPNIVGNIVNAKAATIVAPTGIRLINSTLAGALIDAGTIVATKAGIVIDSASKVTAANTAIEITGSTLIGGIANAGVIAGKIGIDVASGHGVNVFDDGSITGSGGTAVLFKTGDNDFTLGSGFQVTGDVVGTHGDAFQLGGSAADSFDLDLVGAQYRGFSAFNVVGQTWTVSGTGGDWNVDSGAEMDIGGGTVLSNTNVRAGGSMFISAGGVLETTGGGAAIVAGQVTNSGVMLASGAGSVLEITDTAVVGGGGVVEIDNGLVRIQGTGNENVDFLNGGSGGLQIDNNPGNLFAYIGTISGFGDTGHVNHAQYIDLRSVTFTSSGAFADDFVGNTLIVSSGGLVVAEINLGGSYSATDFRFTSGAGGTVEITDPAVPDGPQAHSANVALFANYIANFAAEAHGALLVANTGGSVTLPPVLVHPHA